MSDGGQQTPAGWYPDPERPGAQRYWDGTQWGQRKQGGGVPTWAKVAGAAVLALFGLGMCGALLSDTEDAPTAGGESSAPAAESPAGQPEPTTVGPRFKGRLVNAEIVDPATVRVYVMVRNTGDEAGVPSCTVRVSNESDTYDGFDIFSLDDPIRPGKQRGFNGLITVTNEGAAFVTESDVDCS